MVIIIIINCLQILKNSLVLYIIILTVLKYVSWKLYFLVGILNFLNEEFVRLIVAIIFIKTWNLSNKNVYRLPLIITIFNNFSNHLLYPL